MFKYLRWTKWKIYLAMLFLVLLTIEYSFLYFKTYSWSTIECKNFTSCVKILFVADPQLIGKHNENLHWLSILSIWDSDRYLSRSFSYAYNHVRPDVIVFLGDLFDEGSTATDQEFNEYLRRLFNIFLIENDDVRYIWLPGDNDIGEEFGSITPHKVKRFEHAFNQPDIISIKKCNFYKINKMTVQIPVFHSENDFNDLDSITIGISHFPMLFIPSPFVEKMINKIKPHLIFSADEHKSMQISMDIVLMNDRQVIPIPLDNYDVYSRSLGVTDVYEFIVPTCSYRMGTDTVGYGFGVIEDTELRYTVLWLPARFFQFYVLLFVLFLQVYIFTVSWIVDKWGNKMKIRPYSKFSHKI